MNMTNTTTEDGAVEVNDLAFFFCILTPFIFYCCVVGVSRYSQGERQIMRCCPPMLFPRHGQEDGEQFRHAVDLAAEKRRAFIRKTWIIRSWKAHLTAQDALSSSNDDDDDDVKNDATDSRNECPICWNTFHNGSLICESNNPACSHVYDACCMEQWLMKHDVCPICRERYLIVEPV
jgi:hypothetical protein